MKRHYSIRKNIFRKIVSLVVVAAFIFVSGIPAAFAIDLIDMDKDCTLTLEYHYNKLDLKNVRFYLYKVADIDSKTKATFTLSEDFKKYVNVKGLSDLNELNDLDSEKWADLASLLDDYIGVDKKNSPAYKHAGNTSDEGSLTFIF